MHTIDLFDSATGLVNGHTATVTHDSFGLVITTSTGLTGRLITAARSGQHWYLVQLVTTGGFTALVHSDDWREVLR